MAAADVSVRNAGVSTRTAARCGSNVYDALCGALDEQAAARSSVAPATQSQPAHARPSWRSSFAATAGSVGPSPYDGHSRQTGQAPHAGLRAWQHRLPCQMR